MFQLRPALLVAAGVALALLPACPTPGSTPAFPACEADSSADVVVLGVVVRPGAVPWQPGITVADAIEAAGGVVQDAVVDPVRVRRRVGDRDNVVQVRDDARAELLLCPGDVVQVPERPFL